MSENAPSIQAAAVTVPFKPDLSGLEDAKRELFAFADALEERLNKVAEGFAERLRRLELPAEAAARADAGGGESRPSSDPDAQILRLTMVKLAADVAEIRETVQTIAENTTPED